MRGLVVTADDFGASVAVNDAVELGHREGILTAASLMVTGDAAADAVARARRMPGLGVGLHLVLVDGRPMLPPDAVPDLVGRDGRFRANMVRAGIGMALRPAVRRQLAAEVAAQFDAFAATGLALDHVNAHKHFHLHPTIAALIVTIGRHHGLRAARAPIEPRAVLAAIERVPTSLADRIAAPWARRVRARFRAAALVVPDQVFGLAWTGQLTTPRLAGLIARLPPGLSEIYLHPAMTDDHAAHAAGYRHRAELAALIDPGVRAEARGGGLRLGRFADFVAGEVA